MSYIQQSLGSGETVVTYARFHKLYTIAAWLALLIPLFLFLAALVHAGEQLDAFTVATGLLLVLGLAFFARVVIRQLSTEIGVTSHRFVEKHGLLSMHTNEIALPNIEGIRVSQPMLGRLLGYGTVRVEGTGIDSVTTPNIADPVGFVRAIQTAKELMIRR